MLETLLLALVVLAMIRFIVNAIFPGAMDQSAVAPGLPDGNNNATHPNATTSGPSISGAFHLRRTAAPSRGHLVPPAIPLPLHVCQTKALLRRLLPEDTIVLSILRLPAAGLLPLVREIQGEERKIHQEAVIDRSRFPQPGSSVSVWDLREGSEEHEHWHYLVTRGLWGEVDRVVLNQIMLKEEEEKAWEEKWGEKGEVVPHEEERMFDVVEKAKLEEKARAVDLSGSGSSRPSPATSGDKQKLLPHLFSDYPPEPTDQSSDEADAQLPLLDSPTPALAGDPNGKTRASPDEPEGLKLAAEKAGDGDVRMPSALVGQSPWKIKQIEIELKSHDQGWSDTPQHRGTYENSYTWFDVGIKRDGRVLPGWYTIQRNKHATKPSTTHLVRLDLNHPLWRSARRGDHIVVMGKARFPGWVNHVQKAEVRVTYGF